MWAKARPQPTKVLRKVAFKRSMEAVFIKALKLVMTSTAAVTWAGSSYRAVCNAHSQGLGVPLDHSAYNYEHSWFQRQVGPTPAAGGHEGPEDA